MFNPDTPPIGVILTLAVTIIIVICIDRYYKKDEPKVTYPERNCVTCGTLHRDGLYWCKSCFAKKMEGSA